MKPEEVAARDYLARLGMGDPVYEPDGAGTTPDFCLAGKIAVEVRRLNENFLVGVNVEGLEELRWPLWGKLKQVLLSFGASLDGVSYVVGMNFKRPLPRDMALLGKEMRKALEDFLAGTRKVPVTLQVRENLELDLEIWSEGKPLSRDLFRWGGDFDDDNGGPVGYLYATNIRHCIMEKNEKIAPHRMRYSEWWLVLVDAIHSLHTLPPYEVQYLRNELQKSGLGAFHKLVAIDYHGKALLFQGP